MAVTCGGGFYSSRSDKRKLKEEQKSLNKDPYEMIALATIEKAVKDWIILMLKPDNYRPEWMHKRKYPTKADAIADIEKFMLSEEWKMYTDLNGEVMLNKLYQLYENNELEMPTKEFGRAG